MRVSTNFDGAIALEVAIRCFRTENPKGATIYLVGVTHMGTEVYYSQLQRLLDEQTLVFYEGVGINGDCSAVSTSGTNQLQRALANALGLRYQLDALNYSKPNFRNSDLTLDQIRSALLARGLGEFAASNALSQNYEFELLLQAIEGRGLGGAMARLAVGVIAASPRIRGLTTIAFIELLGRLPPGFATAQGLPPGMKNLLRVLIEERNNKVVDDLSDFLRRRPAPRSVAIIYGAGHMPDLEKRLMQSIRCKPAGEIWLSALSVDPRKLGITEFELNLTRRFVQQQLELLTQPKDQ